MSRNSVAATPSPGPGESNKIRHYVRFASDGTSVDVRVFNGIVEVNCKKPGMLLTTQEAEVYDEAAIETCIIKEYTAQAHKIHRVSNQLCRAINELNLEVSEAIYSDALIGKFNRLQQLVAMLSC